MVIELSDEQIRHVYEMRMHLATLFGSMSAKPISEANMACAKQLLDDSKALQQQFSPKRYIELNHLLHNLVTDLIGNTLLQSFWQQSYYQAASTWYRIATLAEADAAAGLILELNDLNGALQQGELSEVGFVQRIHIGYGISKN